MTKANGGLNHPDMRADILWHGVLQSPDCLLAIILIDILMKPGLLVN